MLRSARVPFCWLCFTAGPGKQVRGLGQYCSWSKARDNSFLALWLWSGWCVGCSALQICALIHECFIRSLVMGVGTTVTTIQWGNWGTNMSPSAQCFVSAWAESQASSSFSHQTILLPLNHRSVLTFPYPPQSLLGLHRWEQSDTCLPCPKSSLKPVLSCLPF